MSEEITKKKTFEGRLRDIHYNMGIELVALETVCTLMEEHGANLKIPEQPIMDGLSVILKKVHNDIDALHNELGTLKEATV